MKGRSTAIVGTLLLAALGASVLIPRGTPPAPPAPQEITASSSAQFCGMLLSEHAGPKGQVFLRSSTKPLWFASIRDMIAFLRLPDMPKDVIVAYVTDMGRATDEAHPAPGSWIDAHRAFYVIGSTQLSGMNTVEAMPFADAEAAQRFSAAHGGRVVSFADIPDSYVFPDTGAGT